ncbi:MAG: hypothetical protein Q9224_004677 [Gallowayella concinna]
MLMSRLVFNPTALSTAFLTISVTNVYPEYLSPGNYDPYMAAYFAKAISDAEKNLPPGSREAANLRARAARLLKQEKVMTPKRRRNPWWGNPDPPHRLVQDKPTRNAIKDALQGVGGLEFVDNLEPQGENDGTGVSTARKERRRERGSMGGKGFDEMNTRGV